MTEIEDTQKRLLEVAGQVFAEKGFKAATVREICQRAEANVAAINYYFRDKDSLYRAVLEHAFRCKLQDMPQPVWPEGTPAQRKLRDLIGNIFRHMIVLQEEPWHMQLLMRELAGPSQAGLEIVRAFIRPIYERLWTILRELLGPELSEERLHLIGFSIVGQCFYHRIARNVIHELVGAAEASGYDAERIANHVADFSLAALERMKDEG